MQNIQIYPAKVLCFPNDCVAKRLFNLTDEDYRHAIEERKTLEIVELKNHAKFGDIISPFRIRVDDYTNFTLSEPLDQFDFAVLCACISEWLANNRFSSPSIIYRAICGKVGDSDANPSKNQLADILQSIDKLMRTQIAINMTDVCLNLKYNGGQPFSTVSAILPCKRVSKASINGKETTIIFFDRKSPILEIAEIKNNQLLFCDPTNLNVHNQKNSRSIISLKTYTLRRILEILVHPQQMKSVITFADIFDKCRLRNSSRKTKLDARNTVVSLLDHLQAQKIIQSFQLKKSGQALSSFSFT